MDIQPETARAMAMCCERPLGLAVLLRRIEVRRAPPERSFLDQSKSAKSLWDAKNAKKQHVSRTSVTLGAAVCKENIGYHAISYLNPFKL